MNDLFLSIDYNEREFEKIEDFKSSLAKEYNFQIRPKWIPAAAGGGEFWMTIFLNTNIQSFILGAVTSGFLWDVIKIGGKKYFLKPLFDSLEKLNTDNLVFGGLNILKLKFQFDNCEIIVGGLIENFTSVISSVFNEVSKMKPKFERENNNLEVIKIELPIDYNPNIDKKGYSPYRIDVFNNDYSLENFKKLWKITFATEHPVFIYDFLDDKYLDPNPNN